MKIATSTPDAPRWGICIRGATTNELTAEGHRCRQFARGVLNFTTEPRQIWSDPNDMLQVAEDGQISDLVTPGPHRISSDLGQYIKIEKQLCERGVRVHFADGCPDGSTEGNLTVRAVSYSQEYPDFPDSNHKADNTAPVAAEVAHRMADAGMSAGRIAAALNRQGIPTPTGRQWAARAVRRLLSGRLKARNTRSIISETHYRRVQERLDRVLKYGNPPADKFRGRASGQNRPALLAGLLRCGECGCRMVSTLAGVRRYYQCASDIQDPDSPRTCPAWPINAMELEREAWNYLTDTVHDPAGAIAQFRDAGVPLTPDEERRLTDRCHQIAPSLDGLDQGGKRGALRTLGVEFKALKAPASFWIRATLDLNSDGRPAEA